MLRILSIGFIMLLSCNHQPRFEREDQIKAYLSEEHSFQIPQDKDLYIILFSGQCGSCNKRTVDIALQLKKKENSEIKVILHKDFLRQIDAFDSLAIDTFHDKDNKLLRYGLDFDKNLILYFSDQRIKYWNWLYMDQIFSVRDRFDLGEEDL